ncbi:hypothetical protein [Methylobacillus sp. Pita1]|uniref:hypothetical protein n=1 Tax=Methylobacillus sp. Pita1 TaxID=3382642 RepID=UPI0038B4EFBD
MYYLPGNNPYLVSDLDQVQIHRDTKRKRRARNNLAALVIGLLIGGALALISGL